MLHARRTNALAGAMVVTLCLLATAVFAAPATASRAIGVSPAGNVTAGSVGSIGIAGGVLNARCSFSVSGTMQSQVVKAPGAAIASFRSGIITNCTSGPMIMNFGSGWSMTYDSFSGVLPAIASVDATRTVSFTMQIAGILCTWSGGVPLQFTPPSALAIGANRLPLTGGPSGLCPATVSWSGSFTLTPGQTLSLL